MLPASYRLLRYGTLFNHWHLGYFCTVFVLISFFLKVGTCEYELCTVLKELVSCSECTFKFIVPYLSLLVLRFMNDSTWFGTCNFCYYNRNRRFGFGDPEPDVSVVLDLFSDPVHSSELLHKNIQHHNWNLLWLLNCLPVFLTSLPSPHKICNLPVLLTVLSNAEAIMKQE